MANTHKKIKTFLMVGKRGSGKSYQIKKLLSDLSVKSNRFLISPTAKLDKTFNNCFLDHQVFTTYTDDLIDMILNIIKEERKEIAFNFHYKWDEEEEDYVIIKSRVGKQPKYPSYLLVLDDIIGTAATKARSAVSNLFCNHRHFCLHVIIASQNYKSIPPIIRNNSIIYYIWETNNKEAKKIEEEHNIYKTEREFLDLLENKTSKPYQALIIDYLKPKNKRYSSNF